MPTSQSLIGVASYGLGALAYLALFLLLLVGWRGRLLPGLFALACGSTAAWVGTVGYYAWTGVPPDWLAQATELLRSVSWLAFLWAAAAWGDTGALSRRRALYLFLVAAPIYAALLALDLAAVNTNIAYLGQAEHFVRLLIAVCGLVLTENLFRNTPADERWTIKFLCFAMAGMFVYDLIYYADLVLFHMVNPILFQARGGVQLLLVPLLAVATVRSRSWHTDIHVSRRVALHSTALIAGGVYLFLIAAVGFYVRQLGGASGAALQVVYFFGAAVLLAIVLFSGTVRAYTKVFISKHFYSHKYDYRAEWLRFVETLSAQHLEAPLEERVVRAIANIVDSPGGMLMLLDGHRYSVAASWNMGSPSATLPVNSEFVNFLAAKKWVVDLQEADRRGDLYEGVSVPGELAALRKAWLAVPLWHHELIGFVVLVRSRAPRVLGWEDFDLLKTVGRQAASYLAEQRAMRALDEVREFEIFNRRFAFVLHDIKNLVSQLSLGAANLEKHGEDREFRKDMARTVRDATEKMKRLIDRINAAGAVDGGSRGVSLHPLIDDVVANSARGPTPVEICGDESVAEVLGDRDRLSSVLGHLVQNAVDAAGPGGHVAVSVRMEGKTVVLDVADDGPGMDRDFIRDELFKPFRSSKQRGMGIGAFQCRDYVREMGGDLDVISEPGRGTTMRVTLPVAETADATQRAPVPAGAP